MRHDYDLPADWATLSPEQKDRWLKQERNRRQAMRQDTPFARHVRRLSERRRRRAGAHPATVDVRDQR